jgi:hypothetical protein
MPGIFKPTYKDRNGKTKKAAKWYGYYTDAYFGPHCLALVARSRDEAVKFLG